MCTSNQPLFFGANLTALHRKGGGVRPIAVGCTLRQLVAKVAVLKVRDEMSALLSPRQLGYGITNGAEAAVHAARLYLSEADHKSIIVKLDFNNAFNSIKGIKCWRLFISSPLSSPHWFTLHTLNHPLCSGKMK